MKQLGEKRGDLRIAGQRLLHIVLAEGKGGLAQEFRHQLSGSRHRANRAPRRSPAG